MKFKVQNIKNFIFIISICCILLCINSKLYSLPQLVITEVAPDQSDYQDWIEIFTYDKIVSTDIFNLTLEITHHNTSKMFSFSNIISSTTNFFVDKGKFIIIYINAKENSYFFDDKNNLVIKTTFTMATHGMYASDVIVSLKTSTGAYIDVLCFADSGGSTGNAIKLEFDDIVKNNQWIAEGWNINTSSYTTQWVVSSVGVDNNTTIQRIRNFNGLPKDTNQKTDWEIKPATLGYGYKEVISETQKVVEVDKNTNPFCPEDSNNSFVKINFNIEDFDAKKTIVIYNISGKEIIKLLDKDRLPNGDITTYSQVGSGSITWDGKTLDGSRVATGVYIVYFEAYNPTNAKKYVGKDVIVVGRKF
ncbi:MAG: hypothetical protein ACK4WJ_01680 [Endomicrobiia bacterium]